MKNTILYYLKNYKLITHNRVTNISSKHSSLFLNIDDIDPFSTSNIDLSVNGPILRDKLFYFTNFRSIRYEGPYSGQKIYNYHNVSYFDSTGSFVLSRPEIIDGDSTYPGLGSKEYVPMDWNENNYYQLKILYKPSPLTRVNFTQITNNKISQYYDRMYKYNPDGQLKHYDNSRTSILQLTKNLTKNTYFEFRNNKLQ